VWDAQGVWRDLDMTRTGRRDTMLFPQESPMVFLKLPKDHFFAYHITTIFGHV
jgi:hypothetical protein